MFPGGSGYREPMPTRGRKTPLTVAEGAAVLIMSLGAITIAVSVLAKLGTGPTIGGLVILALGVGLLSYRILNGRPVDPDGSPQPPTEN